MGGDALGWDMLRYFPWVLISVLGACSTPSPTPSEDQPASAAPAKAEVCDTRVQAMVDRQAARVGAPAERPIFPMNLTGTKVPALTRGWQPVTEMGYRLRLPATGPIVFPLFIRGELYESLTVNGSDPLVADTQYRDDEIADKLAATLDLASSLSLRDCALEPLYIAADADVPLARLERVRAVVPTSMAPRIIIARSGAAVAAEHARRAPFSPGWWQTRIAELIDGREYGLAAVVTDLGRAVGADGPEVKDWPCRPLAAVFEQVAQNGGTSLDTMIAGSAEALRACRCERADVDALESLLLFVFTPLQSHGYLDLPAPGQPLPSFAGSAQPATVAELARALAGQ